MTNLAGRTIKLFLVDGVPDGMRTAEIMSWTGHVLFAPRASITSLLARPESKRTGAYLLIGPDPSNPDQTMVYVGEGDNVGGRLAKHNKDPEKEFWDYVCIITSKDLNLTKAHVRYLESELIRIIGHEGRATLANRSEPTFALLPEADLSDMSDFTARLQILLPVLGADFVRPTPQINFTKARTPEPGTFSAGDSPAGSLDDGPNSDEKAEFRMSAGGLSARAVQVEGQMIVLKGSQSRLEESPSLAWNVRVQREQLRKSGKLRGPDALGNLLFEDDVAFTSPSAAAAAVMATSRNGRTDWINCKTNESYAAWQERLVQQGKTAAAEAPVGETEVVDE